MRIVVFGTGDWCYKLQIGLKRHEIIAYIDNDKTKHGKYINGIKIWAVENVLCFKYDVVLLCSQHEIEMRKQLIHIGISSCKICSVKDFFRNCGRILSGAKEKMLDSWLDIDYFKKKHFEMQCLSDADIVHYFYSNFEKYGLLGAECGVREGIIGALNKLSACGNSILEIGPFDNPLCKGDSVRYFDIYDAEQLRREAQERGREYNRVPSTIHYVNPTGDLSQINEKFDIVFSAHNIEHHPNLIKHIKQVEMVLKPNGYYVMIVPDKRYCFDYYTPESSIGQIIEAYESEKTYHSLSDILHMSYFRTHNDSIRHWNADHGEPYGHRSNMLEQGAYVKVFDTIYYDKGGIKPEEIHDLIDSYHKAIKENLYIDAHCNRFTPQSFDYIFTILNELGYISMKVLGVHNTIYGRQEFCVILSL